MKKQLAEQETLVKVNDTVSGTKEIVTRPQHGTRFHAVPGVLNMEKLANIEESSIKTINTNGFNNGPTARVGNSIYVFKYPHQVGFKFDMENKKLDVINSVPDEDLTYGRAASIGNNIYIFHGFSVYKFDAVSEICTKLDIRVPYEFLSGIAVSYNDDIHLIGGSNNSPLSRRYHFKFDTITNTFTRLEDVPIDIYEGMGLVHKDRLYIFMAKTLYRYNMIDGGYEKLADNPHHDSTAGGCALYDDDTIRLFGGSVSNNQTISNYIISTNSYTKENYSIGCTFFRQTLYYYKEKDTYYIFSPNDIGQNYNILEAVGSPTYSSKWMDSKTSWTTLNSAYVLVDDELYLFGGDDRINAYRINLKTGYIKKLANMDTALHYVDFNTAIAHAKGKIYMFGYSGGVEANQKNIIIYDIATDTYSKLDNDKRFLNSAAIYDNDNTIYVTGGEINKQTMFEFKIDTNTFLEPTTMPWGWNFISTQSRSFFYNNKIYIINSYLYIYDVSTKIWEVHDLASCNNVDYSGSKVGNICYVGGGRDIKINLDTLEFYNHYVYGSSTMNHSRRMYGYDDHMYFFETDPAKYSKMKRVSNKSNALAFYLRNNNIFYFLKGTKIYTSSDVQYASDDGIVSMEREAPNYDGYRCEADGWYRIVDITNAYSLLYDPDYKE